jgi:transposase
MFYKSFGTTAIVGVEATGSLDWFEKLLFDNKHELLIGHPTLIRRRAASRHKSDKRDAELILDLLVNGEFPEVARCSPESRGILSLLRFRQSLVRERTSVSNRLQALARRFGLPRSQVKTKSGRRRLIEAQMNETDSFLRKGLYEAFDRLNDQIAAVESKLNEKVGFSQGVRILLSHSGVGLLTAAAIAHTLGDVSRFSNQRQVVSYIGLDPLEKSSGNRQRFGSISKRGSRLCRHLLIQAAGTTRDARLKQFYKQVSARHGKAVARVATARKLLVNLFIMLKEGIDYAEFSRRGTS